MHSIPESVANVLQDCFYKVANLICNLYSTKESNLSPRHSEYCYNKCLRSFVLVERFFLLNIVYLQPSEHGQRWKGKSIHGCSLREYVNTHTILKSQQWFAVSLTGSSMTELMSVILYDERLRNAFICFHYYNEVPRVVYLMKKGIYSACGFKG